MAYNVLGINPGHNGSAALVSDGKLVYFVEEERLSRMKYDGNPYRAMIDIMSKWTIDELVICGTGQERHQLPWTGEDSYTALVRKFYPNVKVTHAGNEHHMMHAAHAFYNSGFDKAIAIIVDGAGSQHRHKINPEDENSPEVEGYEVESIILCEYPNKFTIVHKSYGSNTGGRTYIQNTMFDDTASITKAYEGVSHYLGFGFIEAGKTMGLAPYGYNDPNIPPLFYNGRASKNVFLPVYPAGSLVDVARNPQLASNEDPKEWHRNPEKLSDIAKNLAFAIQRDTQNMVRDLIMQAVETLEINNVVIAGGYGLNCVANYFYKKTIPDTVNLYCEPVSHDGGTAIGAAQLVWRGYSQSEEILPQTTLYHGPEYSKETILAAVENNKDKISVKETTYQEVAQLIADRNIVALYQGRSEAGPRALGNRSILYDPRDESGKDTVNIVKGREWFRPFAGSVLAEDAHTWFDLAGMDESPHMMYAVNVIADKIHKIPSITHVDDTCRIQTVTEEQNKHYYNLIKAFKDITEVPILFNTSFNLAGDPLVETIDDALNTLYRSKMKYLYLADYNLLITKTIDDPS